MRRPCTTFEVMRRVDAIADRLPIGLKIALDWQPGDAPLPPGALTLDEAECIVRERAEAWP